jgi:hypothetical protein
VLEGVSGQHHQRPLGSQPELEKGLGERVGLRAGLAERQGAAPAVAVGSGGEHPLGMQLGAPPKHVRHAPLVLPELGLRAEQERAVGPLLERDARGREQFQLGHRRHLWGH